jgi:hypothetical protein
MAWGTPRGRREFHGQFQGSDQWAVAPLILQDLEKYICLFQNGRPDKSFFAPDCIHPNQKFHSQLARALWVNMVRQGSAPGVLV